MTTDPLLELPDGAGAIAVSSEIEDVVLHDLTRRALAISAGTKLGDAVWPRVRLTPDTIGFCITSVVRRGRRHRSRHFRRWHGVGSELVGRRGRNQRRGADVSE